MSELAQAVIACNREGRILLYNAAARRLFAEDGAALGLGRSVFGLLDRALVVHAVEELERRVAAQQEAGTQFVTATAAGGLLRVHAAAVVAGGRVDGYVLLLADVTVGHRGGRAARRALPGPHRIDACGAGEHPRGDREPARLPRHGAGPARALRVDHPRRSGASVGAARRRDQRPLRGAEGAVAARGRARRGPRHARAAPRRVAGRPADQARGSRRVAMGARGQLLAGAGPVVSRGPSQGRVRDPRGALPPAAGRAPRAPRPAVARRAAIVRNRVRVGERCVPRRRRGLAADAEGGGRAPRRRVVVSTRPAVAERVLPLRAPARRTRRHAVAWPQRRRAGPSSTTSISSACPRRTARSTTGRSRNSRSPCSTPRPPGCSRRTATRSSRSARCASSTAGCCPARPSSNWSIPTVRSRPSRSRSTASRPTCSQGSRASRPCCRASIALPRTPCWSATTPPSTCASCS